VSIRKQIRRGLSWVYSYHLTVELQRQARETTDDLEGLARDITVLSQGDRVPDLGAYFGHRQATLQRMVDDGCVVMFHRSKAGISAILMNALSDYFEPTLQATIRVGPGEVYHFGYFVDPSLAKTGGAIKIGRFAVRYFSRIGRQRFFSEVKPENTTALKVNRFLGYRPSGTRIRRLRLCGLRFEWRDSNLPPLLGGRMR